jgi:YbbR domain-containing protein
MMKLIQTADALRDGFKSSTFKKNTLPKLFSIIFAIVFWIYVMDQVNPEMTRSFSDINVGFQNTSILKERGLTIISPKTKTITVRIKGRRSDVMSVNSKDIKISIDVSSLSLGENIVGVSKRVYKDNVTIDSLSENELSIMVEKVLKVEKSVVIKYNGALKDGLVSDPAVPNLSKISVEGPASLVNSVSHLAGEIDLSSVSKSGKFNVNVIPVDSSGNLVEGVVLAHTSVVATSNIYSEVAIPIKPVLVGTPKNGYKVSNIGIEGDNVVIKNRIDSGDTAHKIDIPTSISTEDIDIAGMSGNINVEAKIVIPENLKSLMNTTTVKVRVDIEKVVSKKIEVDSSNVEYVNLVSGLSASVISPSSFSVTVQDVQSIVDGVSDGDITIVADMKGLAIGIHGVKMQLAPKVKISVMSVVPSDAQIEVK